MEEKSVTLMSHKQILEDMKIHKTGPNLLLRMNISGYPQENEKLKNQY